MIAMVTAGGGGVAPSDVEAVADVDIVIVNYRSLDHTPSCVEAIHDVAAEDGVTVNIIVVNNGDETEALRDAVQTAGGAQIVEPGRNLGFAAGCNLGARQGTAPALLFLNPDATPLPGAFRQLLARLEAFELTAPALLGTDGQLSASCSRTPTATDLLARTLGLHRLFNTLDYPYMPLAAHAESGPVDQAMGAALMIRRQIFEQLGGFDERFFVYYEDVDLCARAKAAGATLYYARDAQVVHAGQGSSSQDRPAATALHMRSRLSYMGKHFGSLWQAVLAAAILLGELPLRLLAALFGSGGSRPSGVLRTAQLLFRSPAR